MKALFQLLFFIPVLLLSQSSINVLQKYNSAVGNEFIYVQSDRPFYEPNETVWFSAWVLDSRSLESSKLSSTIHFEIKDPKGNVIHTIISDNKEGSATNKFQLPDIGGIYTIEAYSDYSIFLDSNYRAKREIQVQNIQYSSVLFDINLNQNMYNGNDSVVVQATIKNAEGTLLREQEIELELFLNGEFTKKEIVKTDLNGVLNHVIRLNGGTTIKTASMQFKVKYAGSIASKFKNIPISETDIDLQFLPESGYMVNGLNSRVAFKALDKFGKPVSVKGKIFNSKNEFIITFESKHDGMGSFAISPFFGESYYAILDEPFGISGKIALPEVQENGVIISSNSLLKNQLQINILSSFKFNKHVTIRYGNEIVYNSLLTDNNNTINLSTKNFKTGIHEITVFDTLWQAIASRMVFLNADRKINVKFDFNKKVYEPREKVSLTVQLSDENGLPIQAAINLSVVNEQMLQYSDKFRENILSSIFLENELKGEVHLPAYYFDKTDSITLSHLDLLMMTNGWKRISWDDIKFRNLPMLSKVSKFNPQKFIVMGNVLGINYNDRNNFYLERIHLVLKNNKQIIPVDTNGNFTIWGIENANLLEFRVRIKGHYSYNFSVYPWKSQLDVRQVYKAVKYYVKPESNNSFATLLDDENYVNQNSLIHSKKSDILASKQSENEISMPAEKAQLNLRSLDKTLNTGPNGISARGSRTDGNATYIDGVRVTSSALSQSGMRSSNYSVNNLASTSIRSVRYNYDGFAVDRNRYTSYNGYGYSYYYNPLHFYPNRMQQVPISNSNHISFYSPNYSTKEKKENPTPDLRKTLYYAYNVKTDITGKAVFEFYNGDESASYDCFVEAVGKNAYLGSAHNSYAVEKPFFISFSLPDNLTEFDSALIPFTIINKRNTTQLINLKWTINGNLVDQLLNLSASESKTLHFPIYILKGGKSNCKLEVIADDFTEMYSKEIKVLDKGFKGSFVFSGIGNSKEAQFTIPNNLIGTGNIEATLHIYPSLFSNFLASLNGMMREPYGCFEQVSSANYPNILAYQLIQKTSGFKDDSNKKYLLQMLQNGYNKLAAYETKQRGFEWYGNTPPHEGLTAYGLLQFHEMKKLGVEVSSSLEKRSLDWLLSRFNNDGSIQVNAGKYGFSGASQLVTTAYVTYALSCIDTRDLSIQIAYIESENSRNFDAYISALLLNIYINQKQIVKANLCLQELSNHFENKNLQNFDADHSITRSYGQSLDIEVMSIAAVGMMSISNNNQMVNRIIKSIFSSRNGGSYFGNTQATVWALKAISVWMDQKYDDNASESDNNSTSITFDVNSKKMFEINTNEFSEKSTLSIDASLFHKGINTVTINMENADMYTYMFSINWRTTFPETQKSVVKLEKKESKDSSRQGDFIQTTYSLQNTSNTGLGQTVCIISVPAGLTLIPEQLKILQEKKVFDYYEIKGDKLILYYAEMGPNETRIIPLAFQALIPGKYYSSPAFCYLYYNPEQAFYLESKAVIINP